MNKDNKKTELTHEQINSLQKELERQKAEAEEAKKALKIDKEQIVGGVFSCF